MIRENIRNEMQRNKEARTRTTNPLAKRETQIRQQHNTVKITKPLIEMSAITVALRESDDDVETEILQSRPLGDITPLQKRHCSVVLLKN